MTNPHALPHHRHKSSSQKKKKNESQSAITRYPSSGAVNPRCSLPQNEKNRKSVARALELSVSHSRGLGCGLSFTRSLKTRSVNHQSAEGNTRSSTQRSSALLLLLCASYIARAIVSERAEAISQRASERRINMYIAGTGHPVIARRLSRDGT